MREQFPLFSGPGHIFLFYSFIAFVVFAPRHVLESANYNYLFLGIATFGFPVGALINATYSAIWNLAGGYVRVGHSGEVYREYRAQLDRAQIYAIHDRFLWSIASDRSIEYFRRRWTHYHLSAQIGVVSLLAIPAPIVIGGAVRSSLYVVTSFRFYVFALVMIAITALMAEI